MNSNNARMRSLFCLLMLGVCFVSGGATCARRQPTLTLPPPPPVLAETPGLAEVAAAVNRTSAVRELSTNTATVDVLTMPTLPKLSATIKTISGFRDATRSAANVDSSIKPTVNNTNATTASELGKAKRGILEFPSTKAVAVGLTFSAYKKREKPTKRQASP